MVLGRKSIDVGDRIGPGPSRLSKHLTGFGWLLPFAVRRQLVISHRVAGRLAARMTYLRSKVAVNERRDVVLL